MEIFFLWDSRPGGVVSMLLAGVNCLCAELSSMSLGCNAQRCKAIHLHPMKSQIEKQVCTGSEQMWFHVRMKHCCSLSRNFHTACRETCKAKAHQGQRELSPFWAAKVPTSHSTQDAGPCHWAKVSPFSCGSDEWRMPVDLSSHYRESGVWFVAKAALLAAASVGCPGPQQEAYPMVLSCLRLCPWSGTGDSKGLMETHGMALAITGQSIKCWHPPHPVWKCQFSSVTDGKKMRPENDGKKTLTLLPFPVLDAWKEDFRLLFRARTSYLIFKF